ncbi:MAG: DUF4957 domain-containing protein, partial [Ignavibacteria bacterium]|nr:DUF4957 domain-containing protein [Ignavibacteria bacterium]
GSEYTESETYSIGIHKSLTIQTDDETNPAKPIIRNSKVTDGTSNPNFFTLHDSASLTLKGLEFDGLQTGTPAVLHLIQYSAGTPAAAGKIGTVKVLNCDVHDISSNVIDGGGTNLAGNIVVDSTIVDNCIFHNTGTAVYYKYNGSNFISLTNSTFNTIFSYGARIAGTGYTLLADNTPKVIIDHTTWYNIGTTDGREIILGEKGVFLNRWTVTNSIFQKQVLQTKTVINIKETLGDSLATITNICLWDIGAKVWRLHTVHDTLIQDPQFANAAQGDFTLPVGSILLTYGTDGKPIGDPRWGKNYVDAVDDNNLSLTDFSLGQNYPNPFNPETKINFNLKEAGMTQIDIYNILGQYVTSLVNSYLAKGEHSATFNAAKLNSGVYVYRLKSGNKVISNKMILSK